MQSTSASCRLAGRLSCWITIRHDKSGSVEGVTLEETRGVLRAMIRFSQNAEAEAVLTDIRDKIRHNVSIGYSIEDAREDGLTVMVHKWRPIEVSIVSIPADVTVGVGRSGDAGLVHEQRKNVDMTQTQLKPRDAATIMDLGHRYGLIKEANEAIEDGKSLDAFRRQVLEKRRYEQEAGPLRVLAGCRSSRRILSRSVPAGQGDRRLAGRRVRA